MRFQERSENALLYCARRRHTVSGFMRVSMVTRLAFSPDVPYRGHDLVYVARVRNGFVPTSRRQVFEKIRLANDALRHGRAKRNLETNTLQ